MGRTLGAHPLLTAVGWRFPSVSIPSEVCVNPLSSRCPPCCPSCCSPVIAVGQSAATSAPPATCCFARQSPFNVGTSSAKVDAMGNGVVEQSIQQVMLDYDAMKLFTKISSTNMITMQTSNFVLLQDFNTRKQYVTMADGSCYAMDLTYDLAPRCLSDNSTTFMGPVTIGSGAGAIQANAWEFNTAMAKNKLVLTSDCVPVIETSVGNVYGVNQTMTIFYYDFQPSIAVDAKPYFQVPHPCNAPDQPPIG